MSPHDASDNTHSVIPGPGLGIRIRVWKAVTVTQGAEADTRQTGGWARVSGRKKPV